MSPHPDERRERDKLLEFCKIVKKNNEETTIDYHPPREHRSQLRAS
jgi:hypothetical protein